MLHRQHRSLLTLRFGARCNFKKKVPETPPGRAHTAIEIVALCSVGSPRFERGNVLDGGQTSIAVVCLM